ncbi:MAG TPA: transposase, partial [Candidatus Margulisiibacteriota bacterium]|nr:transposase [Candidatus Margulisiibacteriota bacterium]
MARGNPLIRLSDFSGPPHCAFDGGRISSDGGVLLLGEVERRLGIAETLARLIADPRNPRLVTHRLEDILRARILAIACG